MAPHQERVIEEAKDLAVKLNNLYKFLYGDTFATIDQEEQWRLRRQFDYMRLYMTVLEERIAAF